MLGLTHLERLLGEREAVGLVEREHAPRSCGGSGLAVAVDAHAATADRVRAVKEQARELARVAVTAQGVSFTLSSPDTRFVKCQTHPW